MTTKLYNNKWLLLCAISLITACDNNPPTTKQSTAIIKSYSQDTVLEGLVSAKNASIKTGMIYANTLSGKTVAQTPLINSNHYNLTIPANTELPIILTFKPDLNDKNNTEQYISVIIHANITHYDISPLTTNIAKIAKGFGGYTHVNMVRAAETTVHVPDENKTTEGFRGDPTKQYGGWH